MRADLARYGHRSSCRESVLEDLEADDHRRLPRVEDSHVRPEAGVGTRIAHGRQYREAMRLRAAKTRDVHAHRRCGRRRKEAAGDDELLIGPFEGKLDSAGRVRRIETGRRRDHVVERAGLPRLEREHLVGRGRRARAKEATICRDDLEDVRVRRVEHAHVGYERRHTHDRGRGGECDVVDLREERAGKRQQAREERQGLLHLDLANMTTRSPKILPRGSASSPRGSGRVRAISPHSCALRPRPIGPGYGTKIRNGRTVDGEGFDGPAKPRERLGTAASGGSLAAN